MLHHRERIQRRDVGDLLHVVGVDVPGVPGQRPVVMQLEQVGNPARRHHLSSRGLVPDGSDQPVGVEGDPQVLVLQTEAVHFHGWHGPNTGLGHGGRREPHGRHIRHHQAAVDLDHLAARPGQRVEEHRRVAGAGQGRPTALGHAARHPADLGMVPGHVLVHPVDAGPRQDVVELVEQQPLPGPVEIAGR